MLINIPSNWGYHGWAWYAGVIRSTFMFDLMELCAVLDGGKAYRILLDPPDWLLASGLVSMLCSLELGQTDVIRNAPTVVFLRSKKNILGYIFQPEESF